jgi:hypothetical protein
LKKRQGSREQGAGGIEQKRDSTPPERELLVRSGGLRPMFSFASQQEEGVISPRSLSPSPCLFVEKMNSFEVGNQENLQLLVYQKYFFKK